MRLTDSDVQWASALARRWVSRQGIRRDAEDWVQDALLRAVQLARKYKPGRSGSLRQYLGRVLVKWLHWQKHDRGKRVARALARKPRYDADRASLHRAREFTDDPAVRAERREQVAQLRACATTRQREVLDGLAQGYSLPEVGMQLGVSKQAIHANVRIMRCGAA